MNNIELYNKIEEYFTDLVRPLLHADGGDITLLEVAYPKVIVQFSGACGTCPSSAGGTLRGIQRGVETIDPELLLVPIEPEITSPNTGQVHPFGGETYNETLKRKENRT